jgi:3-hydroxyisobutyrate dehydrogenase-like beta-hydroxyacid dehydrogenase
LKLALLGTGLMGTAIARKLSTESEIKLVLWNRTRARAEAVGVGAVADSVPEAVRGADLVISCLLDPASLRDVYLGERGAACAATGQTFVETSTAGTSLLPELAEALGRNGSGIIDAPLLGSTDAVEAGKLLIIVGGAPADVENARPVLEHLGDVERVGPLGTAMKLKLIHNSYLGIVLTGAAELLTAAKDAELPRKQVFRILCRLAPYLERRRDFFLDGDYEPVTFALKSIVKDLDLSLDLYHGVGAAMPVTSLVRELYAEAATHSGQLDVSAIVRRYETVSPGLKGGA